MVCDTVKPRRRAASCCSVEVVKGGGGRLPDRVDGHVGHLIGVGRGALQQLAGGFDVGQTHREHGGHFLAAGQGEIGCDAEIFLGAERLDLVLALHDQTGCHRLHAACRQRRLDLFPQHGRKLKTHYAVEHAARLLRVDQIQVYFARMLYGVLDGRAGDLVEHNAVGVLGLEFQHLEQVPRYGLSLAVLIGSQPHGLRLLGILFKIGHKRFLVGRYLIFGFEILVDVNAEILLLEVADMSVARHHLEVGSEIFSDCLGFCRRLHDHQVLQHAA